MANVTREEVQKVHHLLTMLVLWSGAADDTPIDTEIIYFNGNQITLGDIKDAVTILNTLAEQARVR